jgi:CRP/FNR family transcriptional regulator/CRP/FNR family cyclic AMP-dependent transcriptional regulator
VPTFDVLGDSDLLRVVGASVNLFYPAGSFVFQRGSPGDALYIVLSGRVRITDVDDSGRDLEIAVIERGDFFGEMSLLLDTTHTKNVQAVEDSEVLVLMKESFRALLELKPDMADEVRERLEQRRAMTARLLETESEDA